MACIQISSMVLSFPWLLCSAWFCCHVASGKDIRSGTLALQVEDRKGDRLEYPKAVLSLPFSDVGNTYFAVDDYNVNCSGNFLDNGGGKACDLLRSAWHSARDCRTVHM